MSRLIDADALKDALDGVRVSSPNEIITQQEVVTLLAQMLIECIDNAPTIEPSGDLISRQDALMELNGACSIWQDDSKVAEIIKALPSAEPNCEKCAIKELWEETEKEDLVAVVRCKDCIHRIDRRSDLGHFMCEMFYGQGDVSDKNFCQWGERKEE